MDCKREIPVLISAEEIAAHIKELAARIAEDYRDSPGLTVVCVLSGAYIFMADLVRAVNMPLTMDFVRAKSYDGTTSTGTVRVELDIKTNIAGKDVLLVEDILDTGRTLLALKEIFLTRAPRSVKTAVLLDKPARRTAAIAADYRCFEIPDLFVVGYGLDCDEQFRELPYVGIFTQT
ncbi:MAG: hypoxanthine phosphoribosyltransferase [Oscillospiraceae bacterium]